MFMYRFSRDHAHPGTSRALIAAAAIGVPCAWRRRLKSRQAPPPRSGDQHARAERRVTQAEADGGAARCAAIGASRAAALAAVAAWLAPIYTPRPGAGMREEQRWPPARRFSLRKYRGRAHVFSSRVSASLKFTGCLLKKIESFLCIL